MAEFVVYRSSSFASDPDRYHAGRVGKETAKQFQLSTSTCYHRSVRKGDVVLRTSSRDVAVDLLSKLDATRKALDITVMELRQTYRRDVSALIEAAQGIEAGTAETGTGSVHESPVAESDAPQTPPENHNGQ